MHRGKECGGPEFQSFAVRQVDRGAVRRKMKKGGFVFFMFLLFVNLLGSNYSILITINKKWIYDERVEFVK